VTRRTPEADKGCPGAVDSAHPPPKRGSAFNQTPLAEKDGFPRFGDSFEWRGRLGGGTPKGETKAGEERHGMCFPITRLENFLSPFSGSKFDDYYFDEGIEMRYAPR